MSIPSRARPAANDDTASTLAAEIAAMDENTTCDLPYDGVGAFPLCLTADPSEGSDEESEESDEDDQPPPRGRGGVAAWL